MLRMYSLKQMHISTARDMTFPQEYLVLLNVCPRVHTFIHLCTSSALQQDLSFAIQKRHHTINMLKNKHALCVCIVICDSYYHFFFFLSNQRHPYSTIQLYLNRHCIILHTSHLLFSCLLCILSPFILLLFHSCPSPSRPLFSPLLFQTVFLLSALQNLHLRSFLSSSDSPSHFTLLPNSPVQQALLAR